MRRRLLYPLPLSACAASGACLTQLSLACFFSLAATRSAHRSPSSYHAATTRVRHLRLLRKGRQSQGLEARFRFDSGSRPSPSCSARWARSSSRPRRRRTGTATVAASSTSSGVTFTSSSRGGRRARQPHRRTSGSVGGACPSQRRASAVRASVWVRRGAGWLRARAGRDFIFFVQC